MFRRFLSRNVITHSILSVGAAGFTVIYSSHAVFSDRIANLYKLRGADGKPLPLRANIKLKFDEVIRDFGMTEWNKSFYHLFVCEGLEPFQLGSTTVHKGVQIGIPQYMQAADEEEIKHCRILVDNYPVNWDSPDGDRLLRSLQLSENAQKFLIAKLILQGDNYEYLFESFLPSIMLSTFYGLGHVAHSFFDLLHKPFISSIFVYSVIGGFLTIIYLFLKDGIHLSYEKSIEERVFEKGEAYIRGGIDYYEKTLERNKALRKLMKSGPRRYSVLGNEVSLIRSKGLPETFKLKMAIEYLEKDYQKQYATQIPTPRQPQPIM